MRNLFGVTDHAELQSLESDVVFVRQTFLENIEPYEGPLDFDGLCEIHRILFQDVYDWAGEVRSIGLAKHDVEGPDANLIEFLPARLIRMQAKRLFATLPPINDLKDAHPIEFAKQIGEFLVGLNNLHPFREGNGRTQRLFIKTVADRAGIELAWDVVTRERMIAVSVQGANGDSAPMCRLLSEIIDADRVRALRKALAFLKSTSVPWNDLYIATTVEGQIYQGVVVGRAPPDFMLRADDVEEEWIVVGDNSDIPEDASSGKRIAFTSRRW